MVGVLTQQHQHQQHQQHQHQQRSSRRMSAADVPLSGDGLLGGRVRFSFDWRDDFGLDDEDDDASFFVDRPPIRLMPVIDRRPSSPEATSETLVAPQTRWCPNGNQQQQQQQQQPMVMTLMASKPSCQLDTAVDAGRLWLQDGPHSFLAFRRLLQLLQLALDPSQGSHRLFVALLETLNGRAVQFLTAALPVLIDSDNGQNTDYVDLLLLHLSICNVNTGRNLLAEFIASVPYFGGFYLRQHGKQFEELFAFIHTNQQTYYDQRNKQMRVVMTPHYLCSMHFTPKKVIVSNAPPVKLKRRRLLAKEKFECEVSAGGLVSGIKPSLLKEDIWVAYLDTDILDLDKLPSSLVPRIIKESVHAPAAIRRSTSVVRSSVSLSDEESEKHNMTEFLYEKADNDFLSLQRRLDSFAEKNFIINPLIILKDDHRGFYNGVSNGLFWPAFHNLPEYIIDEYNGAQGRQKLAEDWERYIKVNHHFAIHAARNCRQQDLLWIHDYHMFLVGLILRSLDPTLDCAFFLHIPFGLSDQFIGDFPEQGLAVLRGLLGFTRVGFQSNKDTNNFVRLIGVHFPDARVRSTSNGPSCAYTIVHENVVTDVGTFPISVKIAHLHQLISNNNVHSRADDIRRRVMQGRTGKLFLSVERFDYTKGIVERLRAIERYFAKYPERIGLDVFYQIASSSRSDVSSYRSYQKQAIDLVETINRRFCSATGAEAVILDQNNHPMEEVVWMYLAADVAVVTPLADGMNLVIKEAVFCNPKLTLILSTGAGAENQFFDNNLSDCYLRVEDPRDPEAFAGQLRRAVNVPDWLAERRGVKLRQFVERYDIDYWIESFTDAGWTHRVVRHRPLTSYRELQALTSDLALLRRQAVHNYLNGLHVGLPFALSLRNIRKSLDTVVDDQSFCEIEDRNDIGSGLEIIERGGRGALSVYADSEEERRRVEIDRMFIEATHSMPSIGDLIAGFRRFAADQDGDRFLHDYHRLSEFLQDFVSVDLAIIDERFLIESGFSAGQCIASGVLWARFIDRFSTYALITTADLDQFRYRLSIPFEYLTGCIVKPSETDRSNRSARIAEVLDQTCDQRRINDVRKLLIFGSESIDTIALIDRARRRFPGVRIGLVYRSESDELNESISISDDVIVQKAPCHQVIASCLASCVLETVTTVI